MQIGFIGCGKMAEAMISSLLDAAIVKPSMIIGNDVDTRRLQALKRRYGIRSAIGKVEVARYSSVIFLAVKPYQMHAVLEEISDSVTSKHLIISIAAGIPLSLISATLSRARIVRTMPNMPCLVSGAMTVYCMGPRTRKADQTVVRKLLGSFGASLELPERLFSAVTALSGSGPGFFSYMLNEMVKGAVLAGLSRKSALELAEQTMLGTARLLLTTKMDPETLVSTVATPGGTTAAGLQVLAKHKVDSALQEMVQAAASRCSELANSASQSGPLPAAGQRKAR